MDGTARVFWIFQASGTVAVPGEGHALFLRDPDRFRDVLLDCLATSTAER